MNNRLYSVIDNETDKLLPGDKISYNNGIRDNGKINENSKNALFEIFNICEDICINCNRNDEKLVQKAFFFMNCFICNFGLNNAARLRRCEKELSKSYRGKAECLWNSDKTLKYININNLEDIEKAIKLGYSRSPVGIIDDIKMGLQIGLQINDDLPPQFFRLPSSVSCDSLIVGGERSKNNNNDDNNSKSLFNNRTNNNFSSYNINFDDSFYPDILADGSLASTYCCIPDNKFKTIEFNYIYDGLLLDENVLKECSRILEFNGQLIFKTQRDSKDYFIQNNDINKWIHNILKYFGKIQFINLINDKNWSDGSFFYYELIAIKTLK